MRPHQLDYLIERRRLELVRRRKAAMITAINSAVELERAARTLRQIEQTLASEGFSEEPLTAESSAFSLPQLWSARPLFDLALEMTGETD